MRPCIECGGWFPPDGLDEDGYCEPCREAVDRPGALRSAVGGGYRFLVDDDGAAWEKQPWDGWRRTKAA